MGVRDRIDAYFWPVLLLVSFPASIAITAAVGWVTLMSPLVEVGGPVPVSGIAGLGLLAVILIGVVWAWSKREDRLVAETSAPARQMTPEEHALELRIQAHQDRMKASMANRDRIRAEKDQILESIEETLRSERTKTD